MNENTNVGVVAVGSPAGTGAMDPLARSSESSPNVAALQEEYRRAWTQDPDVMNRIAQCEDIRYTRWAGQSPDGLKHQELLPEGQRAMPYDRAPDCRVPLADDVIGSLVDDAYAAFFGARVKIAPASAATLSVAQAAEWRKVMTWLLQGPLRAQLVNRVEFASQVMWTIGCVVLHPVWNKKTQLRLEKVSLEQIMQLAGQAPQGSALANLPQMIADPAQEESAVSLFMEEYPNLKMKRARQVVRELRADPTELVEFPVADTPLHQPEIAVLVPWQDVVLPTEGTVDPEHARWIPRRIFFNQADLEIRAKEEEWDAAYLAAIIKYTKGLSMENGSSPDHAVDINLQLFEMVYAYQKQADDDGIMGIWCTVFSPHLGPNGFGGGAGVAGSNGDKYPVCAKHWLVDLAHGQLPFEFLTTEVTGRRPTDARGVPDVVMTSQMELKQQRDATYVFSQMSTIPPLQKRGTAASKLPPELGPGGIINNPGGSDWSWFPPPEGNPEIAFKLQDSVRKENEDRYGIERIDTPPTRPQKRKARLISRWLGGWGNALWQLGVLAYQNLSPDELAEILGRQATLDARTLARHRLTLWFDVRALDNDWVKELLTTIAQFVLPADTAGVVDRAKLIQFAMAYLEPTLAEEVTTDQEGAKQAIFQQVRNEIAQIMLGNEAQYVENDPTAKMKLLFVSQIIDSNPDYAAQLVPQLRAGVPNPQYNERKHELLQKYVANLKQSAVQMVDNKVIGRLGVKPGGPQGT